MLKLPFWERKTPSKINNGNEIYIRRLELLVRTTFEKSNLYFTGRDERGAKPRSVEPLYIEYAI